MAGEIIYVCDSTNNKNVREGELVILEKHEEGLYFEFGEDKMNIKKRFYNDLETLNKDFEELLKLKDKKEEVETEFEEVANEEVREVPKVEEVKKEAKKEEKKDIKKNYKKLGKKSDLF